MHGNGEDLAGTDRLFARYGGLLVAGLGFLVTRIFVAETVTLVGSAVVVAATLVPLLVGLALTVAGVALTVGAFTPAYVADVSKGCLIGTGAMTAVLVVTVAGTGMVMLGGPFETQVLVANVLLGGAVGGIVNGHRKATLRSRREAVARGANRARFINRLLRHEVLNAATIIDGHAELLRGDASDRDRSADAIRRSASRIESTINGIGTIAEERERDESDVTTVSGMIEDAIAATEVLPPAGTAAGSAGSSAASVGPAEADGGTRIDVDLTPTIAAAELAADDRLAIAFGRLIEHAIEARGAERLSITASADRHAVTVTVADDGTPYSETARDVLEHEKFPEYDDPNTGFALQTVSLLVGGYDGRVRVENGDEAKAHVRLPRRSADAAAATVGVSYPDLRRAAGAGLVAGALMGGVYWTSSGVLPVIGALYGVETVAVGLITHLFHSVVFALLFVAGVNMLADRLRVDTALRSAGAGLGWGVLLWLVAAGLIMPLWLRAVGTLAPIPNLPAVGLIAHAAWGVTLGAGYVLLGGRFD